MKNIYKILFAILIGFSVSSCETTTVVSSSSTSKWVAPKYTNVEKIVKLEPGMTVKAVEQTLGVPPYDVYTIQEKEVSVFLYYYRIKDRTLELSGNATQQNVIMRGNEKSQTNGEVWYSNTHKSLYIYYKNGEMVSLLTQTGDKDAVTLLLTNNSMEKIARTGITYISNPDTAVVQINK